MEEIVREVACFIIDTDYVSEYCERGFHFKILSRYLYMVLRQKVELKLY